MTVHFHSPRAYGYIRQLFNNNLPHPDTFRKWYSSSSSNGKPGVCEDSIKVLKTLAANMIADGKKLICSLLVDEMAIRKNIMYSDAEKTFYGAITYGSRTNNECFEVAKNAIVFMIAGVNVNFNIPVAFHFIKELNASERAELLKDVITQVTSIHIRLISVTFDGLPANISMCRSLGASFNQKDFRPFFYWPDETNKVYVILDPSHMLKLARNAIGSYKTLYDGENGNIRWRYFVSLETFRNEKGYALAHKVTKKHIQWNRAPMRVRLAAETLSNSVANAMEFLETKGNQEFAGCAATVQFIRYVNNIFDALNSKKESNDRFKTSIAPGNHLRLFSYFQQAIQYIFSLRVEPNGKRLVYSKRRAAFRGLIVDMVNIQSIYHELVETNSIEKLNTFSFSQDPLESLFGGIRSLNGFNDNPNVQQFCAAIRKIAVNTGIHSSPFANCIDSLDILSVSSRKTKVDSVQDENSFGAEEYIQYLKDIENGEHVHESVEENNTFEDLETCNTAHVSSMIEQKFKNIKQAGRFNCTRCLNIFSENDKIDTTFYPKKRNVPCKSSYQICSIANKYFKDSVYELKFDYIKLLNTILRNINYLDMYTKSCFENHEHLKFFIILFIVEEFIRIQAHYLAKNATLKEQEKMMRTKLKKLIHNYGQ